DKIGILKHVYRYGDWAYVGGGMGNLGLHNILEAGVFKLPIIIGKNYEKFPEAIDLIEKGGCFSVSSKSTFEKTVSTISNKSNFFGMKNFNYIKANKGSVSKIFGGLKKYL
ncbi:MAG: 3-deoxy-D-manno-octulosonic acid transferase, partial [Flavobacteriaceae bacterium]|nr:3-deoxy-D-manno-octulosonic acid transferase [Flavobacteriaceae bacterium]